MKNQFDPHRFTLDDREREQLWREIRTQSVAPPVPRSSFGPALAATAVIATVAVIGSLAIWPGDPDKIYCGAIHNEPVETASEPVLLNRATGRPVPEIRLTPVIIEEEEPPAVVRGEIRDALTGEVLGHTALSIADGTRSVAADSAGRFRFRDVPPGEPLAFRLSRLGYAPAETTLTAAPGETLVVALEMEPMMVASLDAIEVQGAKYMVEVKSTVQAQSLGGDRMQKYAIDSVEEALRMDAGAGSVRRDGQLYVRGGRSDLVSMRVDGVASPAPVPESVPRDAEIADTLMDTNRMVMFNDMAMSNAPGSITGGTTPPNGEPYELMYFDHAGVNPFVATDEDALSTFAVDVDDASWTLARSYIERGHLPPPDAVRVEEFVNVYDGGWPEHRKGDLRIHADGAPSRFGEGYHLLRVGLRARTVDAVDRKPALLVFVVDVSGSMAGGNRLHLVKEALLSLVDELHADDRVGLVIYGSSGRVVLEPTGLREGGALREAIASLRTGGSTNAHEGLELAYDMARRHYDAGRIHRLVLCSDGVANTGETVAERILEDVRDATDRGIHLTTVGFGMGNYNDVLMEKLADTGDGTYHYVDDLDQARRVFRQNLTGLLQTVARDAKIQVEFDPERVLRWRLLGYENRDVADRDFRNDDVDAGEVGSGHVVTALYEVKLAPAVVENMDRSTAWGAGTRLGTVRARWEVPAHETARAGEVEEISLDVTVADLARSFGIAPAALRVQAVAAEFAEILRKSYWAKESTLADLVPVADAAAADCRDEASRELAGLVRKAAALADDVVKEGRTR